MLYEVITLAVEGPAVAHRHLVRRQGPGLVGADDVATPQGLHGREVAHQRLLLEINAPFS